MTITMTHAASPRFGRTVDANTPADEKKKPVAVVVEDAAQTPVEPTKDAFEKTGKAGKEEAAPKAGQDKGGTVRLNVRIQTLKPSRDMVDALKELTKLQAEDNKKFAELNPSEVVTKLLADLEEGIGKERMASVKKWLGGDSSEAVAATHQQKAKAGNVLEAARQSYGDHPIVSRLSRLLDRASQSAERQARMGDAMPVIGPKALKAAEKSIHENLSVEKESLGIQHDLWHQLHEINGVQHEQNRLKQEKLPLFYTALREQLGWKQADAPAPKKTDEKPAKKAEETQSK